MPLTEKETTSRSTSPSEAQSEKLASYAQTTQLVLDEMAKAVVGQGAMTRSLILGLYTGGHILLEGLPGLAKTLSVKTLAAVVDGKFQRIQFTPDLLPSDLIGTLIYNEATGEFTPKKGPLFANFILADEINRAPAKVQSALLEAMAEKQITIGDTTYPLEEPFLVLATQNPIEQEGTYLLPEAQLDRFLFKLKVGYPSRSEERTILEQLSRSHPPTPRAVITTQQILEIRRSLEWIYSDERIKEYILRLVLGTRAEENLAEDEADAKRLANLRRWIQVGASPRATLFLHRAALANALLEQRTFVIPDDVKAVAHSVLRHRLILNFDAEAQGISADDVVSQLLDAITVA